MEAEHKEALARRAGSAAPSRQSMQIVQDWLWMSPMRETVGSPWTGDYMRDAARMVDAALAKSPTTKLSDPATKTHEHE